MAEADRQARLIPNSFQVPNAYNDELFPLLTEPELRCVLYAVRRTFGFGQHEAPISVAQFMVGIKSRKTGEYLDHGTGLCRDAVIRSLKSLKDFKVMIEVKPAQGRRPTVWSLQLDYDQIDWLALKTRQHGQSATDQLRVEKARLAIDGRGSGDSDSGLSHRPQTDDISGLSHRPQTDLAVCPTDHIAVCPTDRKQRNRKLRETKGRGKPSNSTSDDAHHYLTLLAKGENIEALLDGLSGIKSEPFRVYMAVGYLIGVPDPKKWGGQQKELSAAKRMLAKGYTPNQIGRCVQYHLSIPFWKNNTSMGLAVIQSKIDAWIAMGEPRSEHAANRQTAGGSGIGDVNERLDEWVRTGGADKL